jgi:flagellar protein FliS
MNQYFEQMILSASPVEIIRLLYRQAISSVCEAREHLVNGRARERCAAINKAWRVLAELMASLDEQEAPDLAARLRALYCYMQGRLIEANAKQADAPLSEVLALLATVAEAWNAVPDPSVENTRNMPAANLVPDEQGRLALTA